MDPSEWLIQFRKFEWCPVCARKLATELEVPNNDPTKAQSVKVCRVHGIGRVVPNEEGRAVFVFDTFDV